MKKLIYFFGILFLIFGLFSCKKQQDLGAKVLDPDVMVQVNPNLGLIPYNKIYTVCVYQIVNPNNYSYQNNGEDNSQTIFTFDISVRNYQMFDSLYYVVGNSGNYWSGPSTDHLSITYNQKLNPGQTSLPVSIFVKRIKDTTGTLGSQLVQIVPENIFFSQNGVNKKIAPASRERNTVSFMVNN